MRGFGLLVVVVMTLVATGCGDLLAVYPLGEGTMDDSLMGEWVSTTKDAKGRVLVRPGAAGKKEYDIVWIPGDADEEALRLTGRLVKIGDRQVFDLVTAKQADLSIPGHFYMLVQKTGTGVTYHWLDSEWLQKAAQTGGSGLAYTFANKTLVLTSPAPALQTFLAKSGMDTKAISCSLTFQRQPAR